MDNDPSSSVNVTGITDAQLAAMQQAGLLGGQSGLGVPAPSVDEMQYATQVASPQYQTNYPTPAPSPSVLDSLPTLDEASNYLANLPAQAQRLLTNPAAFTEMLTGKNPLPEQTGFAASATGLPPQNPNSLFTPAGMAYNKGYESGEPVSIAAMGVPALAPAGRFLGQAAGERIMAGQSLIPGVPADLVNPQILSAVKNKGGNWIDSSLSAFDQFKKPIREESYLNQIRNDILDGVQQPESLQTALRGNAQNGVINNWIDSKLKKYVKNEMGTPTDPVRELADQGITHLQNIEGINPNYAPSMEDVKVQRAAANMPLQGFASAPLGKHWENLTDQAIRNRSAGMRVKQGESATAFPQMKRALEENPWLKTVEPTTPVHDANGFVNDLEFRHLIDELKNSISHNSDLPAHLRLKPETLDKMTVPHAVKHVAKINKYRADQMEKAAKEGLKDFPVVHEGDKGFKIHELKMPNASLELPHGLKVIDAGDGLLGIGTQDGTEIMHSPYAKTPENLIYKYNSNLARNKLDKALKNEGEQMGHCVGGYTDSVASGESRIFSLRDDKGGAHATVEATPRRLTYTPALIPDEVKTKIDKKAHDETVKAGYPKDSMGWLHHYTGVQIQEGEKYFKNNPMLNIEQIKGKGNKAVSDKYRTYIKDWLNKEEDKIGHAEDLDNIGVMDLKNGLLPRRGKMDPKIVKALESGELKRFASDDEIKHIMTRPEVKEQKMLQGFYRGYAGEGAHPEGTTFVSPQKAVADYYAQKRAGQTGLAPHAEMVLADPFAGVKYGHATAGTGAQPNLITQARNLTPEQVVGRTQLYKKGGHVKMNEGGTPPALTPAQMREELFAKSRVDEAERKANEPRTLEQRMIDQGRLPAKSGSGGSGGDGLLRNEISAKNPVYKSGGSVKIPSMDEMRLTILRNK